MNRGAAAVIPLINADIARKKLKFDEIPATGDWPVRFSIKKREKKKEKKTHPMGGKYTGSIETNGE